MKNRNYRLVRVISKSALILLILATSWFSLSDFGSQHEAFPAVGDHNCRFWCIVSSISPASIIQAQLVTDPNSLKNLSYANPNGWSVGYYSGGSSEPIVDRGQDPAYSDPLFDAAVAEAGSATPSIVVSHVRHCSSGLCNVPNPHLFEREKNGKYWLMGHNGTIDKSVLLNLIRPGYLAANPPVNGTDQSQWIDSELYFIFMMQTMEDYCYDVKPALGHVIQSLCDEIPGTGEQLNFFLTDGNTLWGYRQGNSLYYFYSASGTPYSILASQYTSSSQGSWVNVYDGQLVTMEPGSGPLVENIEDYFVAGTITVNDFANYRVFQRDIGGTSRSVTVTGTYTDMDWSRVEARVLEYGSETVVVDWTTIDSTPGGDTFSGDLVVSQGGWYNIEVRALSGTGSVLGSSRGTNKWGVGMIILCIGQSNMSGHGEPPFTVATSDLAVNFSNAGMWEHLADPYDDGSPSGAVDNDNATASGSMVPALANSLLQTFNFPIAFVPSAKDGSNLYSQWAYRNPANHYDTTTLYGQSITKAQSAGSVELIIMHQGEADTNAHRTEAQYEANFATLISHYREDLYPSIPIFICQLGTIDLMPDDARTDSDVQAVRNAQHDLDNGADIFMAATAMDQPRSDDVHYTRLGLDTIGSRLAQAIKYYLGAATYYRGPAIISAAFSGKRNTADIQIVQRGGNDFTPASGITGFSVFSNGSPIGVNSAVRINANTIRLTLASAIPQGATATLRYLWGADPDNTALVKDNSSLALPLENTTVYVIIDVNSPPAVISGITAEVKGDLIPGATVKLYLGGVLKSTTTSDPDGEYELMVTEIGDYTVVASATGFKKETQAISIASLGDDYTLDFIGNSGLIPQAPTMSYVLACANHWLDPPVAHPELALSMSKVLAVANAWLYH